MASDIDINCERPGSTTSCDLLSDGQLQRLKRLRNDQDDEEGEFTEMTSRKSRRISKTTVRKGNSTLLETENFEVSVTSMEPLPKQIAFAKLLNRLKIVNIVKIKYKSSYKVVVTFDGKEEADRLLHCEEFVQKGYRCQRTDQMTATYGIVRNIDLESTPEELLKTFESDDAIITIKRLKRQTREGTWTDSETIRLCFRSSTLPPYVSAYGCRFTVEPYTFPVSQCANCWKYGHIKKFCPIKKTICPKCGLNHENCETKNYRCVNCKGSHMSIEKSLCPMFRKEKDIRKIMCKEQCTYKTALSIYLEKENCDTIESEDTVTTCVQKPSDFSIPIYSHSYRDVLQAGYQNEDELLSGAVISDNESLEHLGTGNGVQQEDRRKKRKKKRSTLKRKNSYKEDNSKFTKEDVPKREKFNCSKFFIKVKEIIMSSKTVSEKISDVLNLIFEELYLLVVGILRNGDYVMKLLAMVGHGLSP